MASSISPGETRTQTRSREHVTSCYPQGSAEVSVPIVSAPLIGSYLVSRYPSGCFPTPSKKNAAFQFLFFRLQNLWYFSKEFYPNLEICRRGGSEDVNSGIEDPFYRRNSSLFLNLYFFLNLLIDSMNFLFFF